MPSNTCSSTLYDVQPDQQVPRVYVETNLGGEPLLTAVRETLARLPVRVVAVTRTGRNPT